MKLVYQLLIIFFNFQTTSNHLHPLQVENCGSNSRLVVDEDDYGELRLEWVNPSDINLITGFYPPPTKHGVVRGILLSACLAV